MKFIKYTLFAAAVLMVACSDTHQESKEEHHHDDEHGDEIVVKEEQQKPLGIKTDCIKLSDFQSVIKCGGEILPSPTSQAVISAKSDGVVSFSPQIIKNKQVAKGELICRISSEGVEGGDPRSEANIRLDAAKKELERVKKRYNSNLATEKELQEAQLAVNVALNSAKGNNVSKVATSPIKGVITRLLVENGSYVALGTPIAVVAYSDNLTLRASIPQRYYQDYALIKSANFKMPYSETVFELSQLKGRRVSSDAISIGENGYFDIEFNFENNGRIVPGNSVEVYLLGATENNVLSVPKESVIEEQGKFSVFVKEGKEHFEKRPVTIGRTDGKRIEITSGLKSGDEIVTEGAIYVKLAANSGVVPEGHHHH